MCPVGTADDVRHRAGYLNRLRTRVCTCILKNASLSEPCPCLEASRVDGRSRITYYVGSVVHFFSSFALSWKSGSRATQLRREAFIDATHRRMHGMGGIHVTNGCSSAVSIFPHRFEKIQNCFFGDYRSSFSSAPRTRHLLFCATAAVISCAETNQVERACQGGDASSS